MSHCLLSCVLDFLSLLISCHCYYTYMYIKLPIVYRVPCNGLVVKDNRSSVTSSSDSAPPDHQRAPSLEFCTSSSTILISFDLWATEAFWHSACCKMVSAYSIADRLSGALKLFLKRLLRTSKAASTVGKESPSFQHFLWIPWASRYYSIQSFSNTTTEKLCCQVNFYFTICCQSVLSRKSDKHPKHCEGS